LLASGYLTGRGVPNLSTALPTAPETGSARDVADRAIFKATRPLRDSARWKLAQRDNDLAAPALIADFRCSLGVAVTPENVPALLRMMARVSEDANAATRPAKEFFHRKRPFLVDKAPVCIEISPSFAASFDYPSGHSTIGWSMGLILTELDPDHATAILARARSFGESRVVCGVHNASAVEAGRVAGAALVSALHGNQAFRADLEKARAELRALQGKAAPAGEDCSAETSLIAKTPY
jgi:acid phosphatase (class A)